MLIVDIIYYFEIIKNKILLFTYFKVKFQHFSKIRMKKIMLFLITIMFIVYLLDMELDGLCL